MPQTGRKHIQYIYSTKDLYLEYANETQCNANKKKVERFELTFHQRKSQTSICKDAQHQ